MGVVGLLSSIVAHNFHMAIKFFKSMHRGHTPTCQPRNVHAKVELTQQQNRSDSRHEGAIARTNSAPQHIFEENSYSEGRSTSYKRARNAPIPDQLPGSHHCFTGKASVSTTSPNSERNDHGEQQQIG
jgi:hypothetical protein